jgi:hypothetical protein
VTAPATPPPSAIDTLIDWANAQDGWVRFAVAEQLATRRELPEARLEELYHLFLVEKDLEAGTKVSAPSIPAGSATTDCDDPLVLVRVGDLKDVNALASGYSLELHPRITLVYGENGAGKSGYVRVLKRVAGVRAATPILPNVQTGAGTAKPEATIVYRVGSDERTLKWKDEVGVAPLTCLDIFDSHAAPLHLDSDLTYAYTPRDLALFPLVSATIEAVRKRLDDARQEATPRTNPFLPRFGRDVSFYGRIESLGAGSDLAELTRLGTVTPEEEAGLVGLRTRVDALRSEASGARVQVVQADLELARAARELVGRLARFDGKRYDDARGALAAADERYRTASAQAFAGEPIPAVLSEPWADFIRAGEEYLKSIGRTDYPAGSDKCIYCQQELTGAAVTLAKKYREYCDSELQRAVIDAQKALRDTAEDVTSVDLDALARAIAQKAAAGELLRLIADVAKLVDLTRPLKMALETGADADPAPAKAAATSLSTALAAEVESLEKLLPELRSEAAKRERLYQQESAALRELEARLILRTLLPDITGYVERAKWASRAGTLLSTRFRGLSKSLTELSKSASDRLLNQDFETRFRAECVALKAPTVNVDFPGRKGEAARRKRLTPDTAAYKLGDILSEGEQKVVELADFLAEASLRSSPAPIIFDDPVTSLDHLRLAYVAGRIVELSASRQVAVFTHNLVFLNDILALLENEKIPFGYQCIEEANAQRGVVSDTRPRLDDFKGLRRQINELLQEAKKQTGEMRTVLAERGYDLLRATCEVVVEADLFQGVSQRLHRGLHMNNLTKIKPGSLDAAIKTISQLHDRACEFIRAHRQPLERQARRATIENLEKDWQALQDARKAYLDA